RINSSGSLPTILFASLSRAKGGALMKKVVMIAYSFPPEGSAGAYRPLRFCRYLPAFGWRASVIAVAKRHYDRHDPGLTKLVPDDTNVIRVRGQDLWQVYQ